MLVYDLGMFFSSNEARYNIAGNSGEYIINKTLCYINTRIL
jgi:hypothetical protein